MEPQTLDEKDVPQIMGIVRDHYKEDLMGMYMSSFYYHAAKNGNILGCMSGDVLQGFVISRYLKRKQIYRIIQIACKKDCCRQGIGSTLFKRISEKGPVILDVQKDNRVALDFYKKMGMEFYQDKNEDQIVLKKT